MPPYLQLSIIYNALNSFRRSSEIPSVGISSMQLQFDDTLEILDGIQVRRIWRPFHNTKSILPCCILQPFLSVVGNMRLVLSFWKTISCKPSTANASIYPSKFYSSIPMYISFLILTSMNIIGPNLFPAKHPHNICDKTRAKAQDTPLNSFIVSFIHGLVLINEYNRSINQSINLPINMIGKTRCGGPSFPLFLLDIFRQSASARSVDDVVIFWFFSL